MKIISYSLFGEQNYTDENRFVFDKYLLGVYFNARMNKILLPDWFVYLHIGQDEFKKYESYINDLAKLFNIKVFVKNITQLCQGMLYRLNPLFDEPLARYVLSRDLDSIITYREARCINEFVSSNKGYHSINDHNAHCGLMGGLIGFNKEKFKRDFPNIDSFEGLTDRYNLSEHGSDQSLIANRLGNKMYNDILVHNKPVFEEQDKKLEESNNCIGFIGSAGCNEMEVLRFFLKNDKSEYRDFEKKTF